MALDLQTLKEHPYATGGIVIVGALLLFYLMSRSSGASTPTANSSSGNYGSALAADTQMAQIQAAATVQTNAQQAQLQTAQLAAQTASDQTQAQLSSSNLQTLAGLTSNLVSTQASLSLNKTNVDAQTTQQQNQLMYAQNIQSLQDSVLTSQINSGVLENANNNATQLAGYRSQLDYGKTVATLQAGVATQGLADQTQVALTQSNNQYNLSNTTLGLVKSAGLNHGTASLENSLVGVVGTALNQPQVGVASEVANAQSSVASSAATASIFNGITKAAGSVLTGAFA